MDREYSLLADLALRLARSPEDVATEGLVYVLSRSASARRLVNELASEWSHARQRPIAACRSQVTATDSSRPDIEAQDENGVPVVIFENKFWAGLTEAQPVTYLERLASQGGLLCFVAPVARLRFLWPEVTRRAAVAYPQLTSVRDEHHLKVAQVGPGLTLAVASWGYLLSQLNRALEADGNTTLMADVRQLEGLTNRMEAAGFLPITVSDLTGPTGRLVEQFCAVVDAVSDGLVSDKLASKDGLRAAAGASWYGRYMKLNGHYVLLTFNAHVWANYGRGPIWLRLFSRDWKFPSALEPIMSSQIDTESVVAIRDGYLKGLWLSLPVLEGRERDDVVGHMEAYVRRVAALLPAVGDSVGVAELPPELEAL